MKTRNIKSKNLIKSSLIILVLFFGITQKGMAQVIQFKQKEKVEKNSKVISKPKHSIKGTPLKAFISHRVNLAYENHLYKDLYIIGEVQSWFLNRDPTFSNSENKSINKGVRYALGIRSYSSKKSNSTSFYLGASLFYGNHEIEERQSPDNKVVKRIGKIKLISQGFKLSIGLRKTFKNGIFIEGGFDTGGAWTNSEKDSITLYPIDKTEATKRKSLDKLISGQFAEPMISIGYLL